MNCSVLAVSARDRNAILGLSEKPWHRTCHVITAVLLGLSVSTAQSEPQVLADYPMTEEDLALCRFHVAASSLQTPLRTLAGRSARSALPSLVTEADWGHGFLLEENGEVFPLELSLHLNPDGSFAYRILLGDKEHLGEVVSGAQLPQIQARGGLFDVQIPSLDCILCRIKEKCWDAVKECGTPELNWDYATCVLQKGASCVASATWYCVRNDCNPSSDPPTPQPPTPQPPTPTPQLIGTQIVASNAKGGPGEQVILPATLTTANGIPLANKVLKINETTVTTDANGVAQIYWKIPSSWRVGHYGGFVAEFKGDASYSGCSGKGRIDVVHNQPPVVQPPVALPKPLGTRIAARNTKGAPGKEVLLKAILTTRNGLPLANKVVKINETTVTTDANGLAQIYWKIPSSWRVGHYGGFVAEFKADASYSGCSDKGRIDVVRK